MATKKFDKNLHKQYDDTARILAKTLLSRLYPFTIKDNSDQYGPDLCCYNCIDGQFIGYIECEVKAVWKGDKFPYSDVQIPYRKDKFLNLDQPILFFMANSNYTQALLVDGVDIAESPIVEVNNVYVPNGEKFFKVPLDKVTFYKL